MSVTELTPRAENAARRAIQGILRVNHSAAVEDVLQEAKFAAFKHQEQFKGDANYNTWFYRIAVNQALVFKRHHKREDEANLHPQDDWESCDDDANSQTLNKLPSQGLNPEERMLALERNQQLVKAVLELPPLFREAILLMAVRQRKYQFPPEEQLTSTQKARRFRAIRMLRQKLAGVLG